MKGQDTYTQVKEIVHGNITIRVFRPDLTEEERKRREARVVSALQSVGKEMMKAEKAKATAQGKECHENTE